METNSKDYDTHASWIPQQNQVYEGRLVTTQAGAGRQQLPRPQNQGLPQRGVGQKPKAAEKMPKARALALVRTLKRWLVVTSIVSFGTFSGLVAFHQVGTTASQSTQTSSKSTQTSSTSHSSTQKSSNFLNQQGGNNFGTSSSSQGSNSNSSSSSSTTASGSSSSSSTPVSGTHTS